MNTQNALQSLLWQMVLGPDVRVRTVALQLLARNPVVDGPQPALEVSELQQLRALWHPLRRSDAPNQALLRTIAKRGGETSRGMLESMLGEVQARLTKIQARISKAEATERRVSESDLRKRSLLTGQLQDLQRALNESAGNEIPGETTATNAVTVATALLDLRAHRRLVRVSSRNRHERKETSFRHNTAVNHWLYEVLRLLHADQPEDATVLQQMFTEGLNTRFGMEALRQLMPELQADNVFFDLVRPVWSNPGLRRQYRDPLRKLLAARGEAGLQLIASTFQRTSSAALKAELLPETLSRLPLLNRWEFLQEILKSDQPKLRLACLTAAKALLLELQAKDPRQLAEAPETATIELIRKALLELICNRHTPRREAALAMEVLRAGGHIAQLDLLAQWSKLSSCSRPVRHRLLLLMRQFGNDVLQGAFAAKNDGRSKQPKSAPETVSCGAKQASEAPIGAAGLSFATESGSTEPGRNGCAAPVYPILATTSSLRPAIPTPTLQLGRHEVPSAPKPASRENRKIPSLRRMIALVVKADRSPQQALRELCSRARDSLEAAIRLDRGRKSFWLAAKEAFEGFFAELRSVSEQIRFCLSVIFAVRATPPS